MGQELSGQANEKRHWIRITRACNNRCLFCLDRESLDGQNLSLQDIRDDLGRGLEKGATRAILSGGEPTLHPQYPDIIASARAMGYRWVQTISNGRMFYYKDFLHRAVSAGLNEITFSLHAHTPDLFDQISGVKGSFPQAVSGLLNALRIKGLVVSVDVVLTGLNAPFLVEIIDFYRGLGVREFDLLYPVPFGAAWANRQRVAADPQLIAAQLKDMLNAPENRGVTFWTNRFPVACLEGIESLIQAPEKIFDEVYGRREMFQDFLEKDKPPACEGERCLSCNMARFCQALAHLKALESRGGAWEWRVSGDTVKDLEAVPEERVAGLILDPAGLADHPAITRLLKRTGVPVTLVHHEPPDRAAASKHASELVLNRATAPLLLKKELGPGISPDMALALQNRDHVEDCLRLDISLKVFFKHFHHSETGLFRPFRNVPPCLSGQGRFEPLPGLPVDVYPRDGHWNLDAVARYFLRSAHYSRSLRCVGCAHESSCPGLHINYIRAFGFAEIPGPCPA